MTRWCISENDFDIINLQLCVSEEEDQNDNYVEPLPSTNSDRRSLLASKIVLQFSNDHLFHLQLQSSLTKLSNRDLMDFESRKAAVQFNLQSLSSKSNSQDEDLRYLIDCGVYKGTHYFTKKMILVSNQDTDDNVNTIVSIKYAKKPKLCRKLSFPYDRLLEYSSRAENQKWVRLYKVIKNIKWSIKLLNNYPHRATSHFISPHRITKLPRRVVGEWRKLNFASVINDIFLSSHCLVYAVI